MGCDFYIVKYLCIYYNDDTCESINVSKENGYYYFDADSDEENYEQKINDYKKNILKPQIKPIVIYDNNTFIKSCSENKYKTFIEDKIKDDNKKWNDITKIIKLENRYERC